MGDRSNRNSGSSGSSGSSGVGGIIGAVVGGVAVAGAAALIGYFLQNRERGHREGDQRIDLEEAPRRNEETQRMLQAEQEERARISEQKRARHVTLMKEGYQMFQEAWEAEKDSRAEEAESKFRAAKEKYAVACILDPTAPSSKDSSKICSLKIQGNKLFNEGLELQQRGNDSEASIGFYKAAWDKFVEAKRVFEEGWIKSKDERFQENIAHVEESMRMVEELLNEDRAVDEAEDEAREVATEHDERRDLVRVIEKKQV